MELRDELTLPCCQRDQDLRKELGAAWPPHASLPFPSRRQPQALGQPCPDLAHPPSLKTLEVSAERQPCTRLGPPHGVFSFPKTLARKARDNPQPRLTLTGPLAGLG